MKLHFESDLSYQTAAIDAVCDLFRGQEVCRSVFTVTAQALTDAGQQSFEGKQFTAEGAQGDADVVLSGLRVVKDGVEIPRLPLSSVARDDFLAGNPGWQGSNTFVKLESLMRVGGFTDGLPSTNDRDLAVRLLGLPNLKVAFTHRMTSTWHIDSQAEALSRPGSPEKRVGLLQFLAMHGHLMSPDVMTKFKARARDLFGVDMP